MKTNQQISATQLWRITALPGMTHTRCRFPLILVWIVFSLILSASTGTTDSLPDSKLQQRDRHRMVQEQLIDRGIAHPGVLAAMRKTPRHWFVPSELTKLAYADRPLPIGEGQTISQPYIVALMSELLAPHKTQKVLEIGTGSGYQAAILSALAEKVFTVEIKPNLQQRTHGLLQQLNYTNIFTRRADGYYGWEEEAPFDGIMITASVDHIPPPLIQQLAEGGRLILPLGNPFSYQNLVMVTKQSGQVRLKQITGVLFVPMTGRALESSAQ